MWANDPDVHRWPARCVAPAALGAWVALWLGCAAPPVGPTPAVHRGGGLVIAPEATEPGYAPADRWDPRFGRMGSYLRARHVDPAMTSTAPADLFNESFEAFDPDSPAPWTVIGRPIIEIRSDAERGRWLELGAPVSPGAHGIETRLPAERIRGRVVLVQVLTRVWSSARARHLGLPQVRWVVEGTGGAAPSTVSASLPARASPDWETFEFLTYFDQAVTSVRLQLAHENTSGPCGFDELAVRTVPGGRIAWLHLPPGDGRTAASTVRASENLLANGSFEVGPRGFVVWSARHWPGRGVYVAPQGWWFDDDAVEGSTSLRIPAWGAPAGVTLGPFDLSRNENEQAADRYHVAFHAKATSPVDLRVEWRIGDLPPRTQSFRVGTDWGRHSHIFLTPAQVLSACVPARAELVFRLSALGPDERVDFWLDGVTFGAQRCDRYLPASGLEAGLFGPAMDPSDVGELLQEGEPAALTARLVNYADTAWSGTVAMDVVDGFDRPVWTKTSRPTVEPRGVWEDPITLTLPRGSYRAKMTVWSDAIGSNIVAQDEQAFGVIDLTDPVPRAGWFGLHADAGRLSARTAQIGSGWVVVPLDMRWVAAAGSIRPESVRAWNAATEYACGQDLSLLVGLTGLPWQPAARRNVFETWLNETRAHVAALYMEGAGLRDFDRAQSAGASGDMRRWLGLSRSPPAVVVPALLPSVSGAVSTAPASAPATRAAPPALPGHAMADGVAIQLGHADGLPEDVESSLEVVSRIVAGSTGPAVWDLRVPATCGSAYPQPIEVGAVRGLAARVPSPIDPVESASRLVRSMLIRAAYGVDYAAAEVCVLGPADTRLRVRTDSFCEYDHAPRPVLAAWDWMTSLLNDAVPIAWHDLGGDARAVVFERQAGRIVAALWRPHGWSVQSLTLAGLGADAAVHDLFGGRVPGCRSGADTVVPINAAVRYVIVPASVRDRLLAALATAHPSPPRGRVEPAVPNRQRTTEAPGPSLR